MQWTLENRLFVLILFALLFGSSFLIVPFIGQDFFPSVDAGQLRLHVRAPSGTRIEVTADILSEVENEIRKVIRKEDIDTMIDNIGVNPVPYSLSFGANTSIGGYDGEILVTLKSKRKYSTQKYMRVLRKRLKEKFPNLKFFFMPVDIVNQILNRGVPSPIDIKIAIREGVKVAIHTDEDH